MHYFEITPRRSLSIDLKELSDFAELFYFFSLRDIKVKYKHAGLGIVWAVLQPLLLMLILSLFMGQTLVKDSGGINYSVFVYSGLILWFLFSTGVSQASNSLISNAHILKKIYFPRLIVPVSAIFVALFDFILSFIVMIPMLILFDQPVDWMSAVVYWPIAILLCLVAALGPGCLLAALNAKYRDFRYTVPFIIQFLFFITPVIYPVNTVKYDWIRYLLCLNPMHAPIALFRMPFAGQQTEMLILVLSTGSSCLFLLWGLYYFKRSETFFADFV